MFSKVPAKTSPVEDEALVQLFSQIATLTEQLYSAANLKDLMAIARQAARSAGYSAATYHQIPRIGFNISSDLAPYYCYNVPEYIQKYYNTRFGTQPDPLIKYVLNTGLPIWLSDATELAYFKESGHDALIRLTILNLGNALAIPLFGPRVKTGYAFLAFGETDQPTTHLRKHATASVAAAFHTRYCALTSEVAKTVSLTLREMEVLEMLVMGKTNPEIACILNISKHTVNSYMKNLFMKFGTHDRVTTVMKVLTKDVVV